MRLKHYLAALSLASIMFYSHAFAATVTTIAGEPTIAASVQDIVLGSTTYNADFFFSGPTHQEIANNLPGFSEMEAEDIIGQIGDALNMAGITTIRYNSISSPGSTFDLTTATLWYAANTTTLLGKSVAQPSLNWTFIGDANAPLNTAKPFFVELTPIPVPAAVWLFGSALIGLLGIRRKK